MQTLEKSNWNLLKKRSSAWIVWRMYSCYYQKIYSKQEIKSDACSFVWSIIKDNEDLRLQNVAAYEVISHFATYYKNLFYLWDSIIDFVEREGYSSYQDKYNIDKIFPNNTFAIQYDNDINISIQRLSVSELCYDKLKTKIPKNVHQNTFLSKADRILDKYKYDFNNLLINKYNINIKCEDLITKTQTYQKQKDLNTQHLNTQDLDFYTKFHGTQNIWKNTNEKTDDDTFMLSPGSIKDLIPISNTDKYLQTEEINCDLEVLVAHFVDECWSYLDRNSYVKGVTYFIDMYSPPDNSLVDSIYLRFSYLRSIIEKQNDNVNYKNTDILKSKYMMDLLHKISKQININITHNQSENENYLKQINIQILSEAIKIIISRIDTLDKLYEKNPDIPKSSQYFLLKTTKTFFSKEQQLLDSITKNIKSKRSFYLKDKLIVDLPKINIGFIYNENDNKWLTKTGIQISNDVHKRRISGSWNVKPTNSNRKRQSSLSINRQPSTSQSIPL